MADYGVYILTSWVLSGIALLALVGHAVVRYRRSVRALRAAGL